MNKTDWEKELKRYIEDLPFAERKKAIDYYNELYADKREAGMSEWEIIDSFGNPKDVAKQIREEYYGNPKTVGLANGDSKRTANFLSVVMWIAYYIALVYAWMIVVSAYIVAGTVAVAGQIGFIMYLVYWIGGDIDALLLSGLSLVGAGIGVALYVLADFLKKLLKEASGRISYRIKAYEEANNEERL